MAPVKRTKRILYAGDHPGAVEDAVSLLPDGETVELRAVADPQAVLEESDSGPVDCLVYEAGVELLSTLREQYPALPVLFVTDEESLAGEAVDAGATDVFVRGSAGGENRLLVHRLDNVLAHRRAARGTPATARALTVRQLSGERADSAGQLAGDTLADLLIETLDDAFYLLDTDGKLIGWNEQFRAVTGYSDDALEGMHAVELFESDDHSRIREAIETVLDTGSVSIEAAVSTAGGERIPFDWTGALLTDSDGNESGIVGIGRDISERKAREQRLELAETVFQQARDAVFLIEVSGEGRFELQRVNPAYELLAGVDAEAVQGKTPTELMGEERGSAVESRYRECVKRREAIEYEEQLSLGDQPQVWHTKLAPIVDDGEVIKLVGATRDITERTEREQRLLELRRAVETVVENVPMVLFSYDSDGVFTRSRGSALRSIGLEPGDAVGSDARELFADHDEILDHIRQSLQGEAVHGTAEIDGVVFESWYQPVLDEDGAVEQVVGFSLDITERERLIEQLRQIKRNASDVIWLSNPGKESLDFISDSYEDVWGRSPESLREESTSFVDTIHPDDRERVEDALATQQDDPDAYEETYRVVQPDGEVRWVHDRASGVYEDGELTRIVGIASDITERKAREQELRVRTRAIEAAPVGITLSDPSQENNPLVYANEAFTQRTGYAEEEVIGENCRFLQGENTDPETVADLRQSIAAAEPISVELRNYRKDGTEFWNKLDVAPVEDEDGRVTNYVGFQQDVTERKEREQELRLRTRAMEEAPIGITIHDATTPGAPISYANEWFSELTGYEQSALDGESITLLTGADTDGERAASIDAALEEGEHVSTVLLLYRNDGDPFWGRVTLAPVTDADGERSHFVGFLQDITETKEHEQEIERRIDEFGELLAEDLRLPLQDARSDLEAVMERSDRAEVASAVRSVQRVDDLIDDLTTVHSFAVKSRDVFDDQTPTTEK